MVTITVHSKEPEEALANIDDLISQLAEPTSEVLDYLKKKMQDYPPPPAGSTYVRTERLKNGWDDFLILAGNHLGLLANLTPYGPYVQGAEDQAAIHAGRWQTDQSVADSEETAVIRAYDDYIQRLLDKR